jgi:prepilin-type N-terminal cleavage/methylation domain-containing protein
MNARAINLREVTSPRSVDGGFSLLELLVVMALLLVLVTLFWSSSSSSRRQQAQAACRANLQKIFVALQIYANDSAGKLPGTSSAQTAEDALEILVPRYTAETSLFICPGSADSPLRGGQPLSRGRISYAYCLGRHLTNSQEVLMSDRQVDTLAKAAGQPVFSTTGKPPGNNHGKNGGNLLTCDGQVQFTPPHSALAVALPTGVRLVNPK